MPVAKEPTVVQNKIAHSIAHAAIEESTNAALREMDK